MQHRFITRRSITVFSRTMLLASVVLSTFFWLFASRISMVPWHVVLLGGLTIGALAVVVEHRGGALPSLPPRSERRSIIPVWQVVFIASAVAVLQRIFPETITPLVELGLVLGLDCLYFGLFYTRYSLTRAGGELGPLVPRRIALRATESLMWTICAVEICLALLGLVYLKFPCSTVDLARRRQGCVVAFDQASYPWELQISQDGSLVVTADAAAGYRDGAIQIWDINDGRVIHTFPAHADRVNALAFAPDGHMLASASDDHTVRIWRVGTEQPLQTLDHTSSVHHLVFTPDGAGLITTQNKTLLVWDTQRGSITQTLVLPNDIERVVVSPDGQIAVGLFDGSVRLWRSSHNAWQTLVEERDRVEVLAFSPNGSQLMTSDQDGVRLWQVADGALLRTIALDDRIVAARFTNQNLFFVTNDLETVFVWQRS